MPDKVPVGTHPGSISGLLNQDLIVAPAATAQYTLEKLFLRTTDDTTDDLVAALHNTTGGGGDSLSCTISDGSESGVSTGSAITVDVGEAVYLRVSAGNSLRQNLSGWFETGGAPAVTTALTTLTLVKRFWGIDGSTYDTLLNELIASVSAEIQAWLDRRILETTATAEKPFVLSGSHVLQLNHLPVISIGSIAESGVALVEDTDFECLGQDKEAGQVIRISSGYPIAWVSSLRDISVTYNHGYASVPEGIQQAARELVLYDFLQSQPGQKRLALRASIHDPGGTGDYMTREECWKAQLTRLQPYRRM